MWTAIVGGASVAMVALLLRHGGSWFFSRPKSHVIASEKDKDVAFSIYSLVSTKCTYPALALAVREHHSSLADYLNLIEQDNLVFPIDEDTVEMLLSYLPTMLSLGHYGFVIWLLKSQKVYRDSLVHCRHGARVLYLSCFADSEEGTVIAQLLIDSYLGLICRMLSSSENDEQHLSVALSFLNMVLCTGPSLSLASTIQSLASLFKVCIQHYHSLPTLFSFLCMWGYTDTVRLLVDHDVRLLYTVSDKSPLYYAAIGGHLELVKLLLAKGADSGSPPAILGALVYLALNNPKRTCLPTRVFSHLPNYYLFKGDWTLRSEQLAIIHDHSLCPLDGVLFRSLSQHADQSQELISVLLDNTSEDVLKPSSLYLTLLALIHDLSIVEPFISRFLQYLVANLDSTSPPFCSDYIMSVVRPASLHLSPELLTSVVVPLVALTPLKHPAVAAQKGYWTILSAMFTPQLSEQIKFWKSSTSDEKAHVITSEEVSQTRFVRSCLVALFYAIKCQEEAIATQVLQYLTSCELGIEYLAGLQSKTVYCENIIFLCCKYRSLSILQQLMAVKQMQEKVTDAVNMAVRVGNLEVLQWLDMLWPTILRSKYWSLVLLAGSRDRLEIVEWLFTILAKVKVYTANIHHNVLFWGTVLQGAAQGAHEDTGLCALGQLSLSNMAQLADHPIFLHAVYWCCCHGLVRLLDAMCVSDQALFFQSVHGTTPFHCSVLNGMVGRLSDLDVFPKIANSGSFFSLAKHSSVSFLNWKSDWDHTSFFIECLSAGWLKHLLDKATQESRVFVSFLKPVVTSSFKQVGPRVNTFLQSVAIGNESVVEAFLSVWSANAGCILHYLQTVLSCRVLQLACNHLVILEMLLKALFNASLIAESISVHVLEACIKSNNLRSLQLLTRTGPSYLMTLLDSQSKRNALHFAAENGVSQQVAAHILGILGENATYFFHASSSHNLTPLMTAIYLGHPRLVALFCAELGIEQDRQAALSPLPINISFKFRRFKNDFMLEEELIHMGWFNDLMVTNETLSLNNLLRIDQLCPIVPSFRNCATSLHYKALAAHRLYDRLTVYSSSSQSNTRSFTEYLRQAKFYLSKGYSNEFIEYIQQLTSDGYTNAEELSRLSFITASTLGREQVVEFMLKNGFVPSEPDRFGEINSISVQGCMSAIRHGHLDVVCLILNHFPQNIKVLQRSIDSMNSTEDEDNEKDKESKMENPFSQLLMMILFYDWENIVRHFAQPSGDSQLLLADVWLTHKFGKHQIKYFQQRQSIEEEWTVESIPIEFDNGETIELKIDWNSFRNSIPNFDIPAVPIGFHAFVISSVLGHLVPFSKSASVTLGDIYPSCSAVHTLSLSCIQSPSQPYSQLDDQSAALVVSYCSATKEFSFPNVHHNEPLEPEYIVPYTYTISVSDQLLMQSNQMRRWARSRQIPTKVDFSDDFFRLTHQSLSCVLPCVAMVIKDIQSAVDLAGRPVALYSESGLIPHWFRNLYQTLFTWLTPINLFNAVHVELSLDLDLDLGYNEQVSVELVEEAERNVIHFSVTLAHHEVCSPPSHTALFSELSRCLLAAETKLLSSQTQQFFSDMWAHQTGNESVVDVLLENEDGVVTPLHQVTTDHIFFLKLYPLFAKAVTNLVEQQECLVRYANLHPRPAYSSLRVILSSANEYSHINRSTQPPSMVLSLWELLHDTMFQSPQLLHFLFETQGLSLHSLSHLPCAMLSTMTPADLASDSNQIPRCIMQFQLQNILDEPFSGSEVRSLFKIEFSQQLMHNKYHLDSIGRAKFAKIYATACDHPIRGSPITIQSVKYASSVSQLTHEQANMRDPIVAIAGHHNNQCSWWRTTPSGWHYTRCMSEEKKHKWIVVKPLINELCDSNIALFVGFKKGDASHKLISQSRLTAAAFPMNRYLTLIKIFFNRTVPLKITAFCIKCHNLLKVCWQGETTCLPRPCLFRSSTIPSPIYSAVRANPPKRVALFSNRYSTEG